MKDVTQPTIIIESVWCTPEINDESFTFGAKEENAGNTILIPHFFFNEDGAVIGGRGALTIHKTRYNTRESVPDDACEIKQEWVNKQIKAAVKMHLSLGGTEQDNLTELYVYVFRRSDIPCLGIFVNKTPYIPYIVSFRKVDRRNMPWKEIFI